MKKEIKEKWIKALRSGEYKQGQYQLKSGNNFCCLGVLCDLHRKEDPGKREWYSGDQYYYSEKKILPNEVIKWAGIKGQNARNPTLKVEGKGQHIASLNDGVLILDVSHPYSFTELADLIEEQL